MPPDVKNSWNKVVKAIKQTIDLNPLRKNPKGILESPTNNIAKTNNSPLVTILFAKKIIQIKRNIDKSLLRGSSR